MRNDDSPTSKRNRGRPRNASKTRIVEQILEATDRLLHDHNHFDLTEQRIAEEAGVDKRLIHYYFGDKEGLLFEVIVRRGDEVMERLRALDAIDPTSDHVTRQILEILIGAHYAVPWIAKVMVSEAGRKGSTIKDLFTKRYGPQEWGPLPLQRAIRKLIECGVYSPRINVAQASASIFFMVTAPLMLASLSSDLASVLDKYKEDAWIGYVSELFDRQFRATA